MPRAVLDAREPGRDLPSLLERTLIVGLEVSSASDTRNPARHCSMISSFAFEVLRYAFLALGSCAVLCLGITSVGPMSAGDAVVGSTTRLPSMLHLSGTKVQPMHN